MRLPFAILAVVVLAPMPLPAAGALGTPVTVRLLEVDGAFAVLSWSPVPGAESYSILRGASVDTMQVIGETRYLRYVDTDALSNVIYGLRVNQAEYSIEIIVTSSTEGDCVSANSDLHIAVTFANCIRT